MSQHEDNEQQGQSMGLPFVASVQTDNSSHLTYTSPCLYLFRVDITIMLTLQTT
jgi:hypothetical protein